MFGSVTRKNVCKPLAPSTRAASSSSRARRFHDRDDLARHERKRHEDRRQHDARARRRRSWMSWSISHGPSQPWRPNSSTKTMPEITGDTANGRSISVISRLLPRKLELARSPSRARRRTRGSPARRSPPPSSVSSSAASASGSRDRRRRRRSSPFENASVNTAASGSARKRHRNAERDGRQQPADRRAARSAAVVRRRRVGRVCNVPAISAPAAGCSSTAAR